MNNIRKMKKKMKKQKNKFRVIKKTRKYYKKKTTKKYNIYCNNINVWFSYAYWVDSI